jgi:uncharacterized membrane protein
MDGLLTPEQCSIDRIDQTACLSGGGYTHSCYQAWQLNHEAVVCVLGGVGGGGGGGGAHTLVRGWQASVYNINNCRYMRWYCSEATASNPTP